MDEDYVKLFDKWNIPFTGKYMIVKYNGEIKYSVNMSNAKIDQLLDSYNKLNKLAEKRYGIQQEELPTILFPIIQDVFDAYSRINKYDLEKQIQYGILIKRWSCNGSF